MIMKINKLLKHGLCGAVFASLSLSQFAYADREDIHFAGFASFAYAKTLDSDEGNVQVPISDITNSGEYRDYSKLGLRMDAELAKDVGFVKNIAFATQVISYGYTDFDPEFDWAYLAFRLTSEVRLDVGRTRMPLYKYSSYMDVGYAYQWMYPPDAVYHRAFIQSMEGAKLSYVTDIGDWTSELIVYAGSNEDTVISNGEESELLVDEILGASWTLDWEWVALRAVYSTGILALNDNSSIDFIADAVPEDSSVYDDIVLQDDRLTYMGASLEFTFEKVFWIAEIMNASYDSNLVINETDAYYMTVGGKVSPKITLSFTYGNRKGTPNDDLIRDYNVVNSSTAFLVEGIVRSQQDFTTKEYMFSARWDFHPQAAFKFEYIAQDMDEFLFETEDANSPSYLTLEENERSPSAYRIGLDLVF